jgi:hypothetical protein
MRNTKQQHNWKLDDERRKRPTVSPVPRTTNDYSPTNYTHEKNHTGILFPDEIQMSIHL